MDNGEKGSFGAQVARVHCAVSDSARGFQLNAPTVSQASRCPDVQEDVLLPRQ